MNTKVTLAIVASFLLVAALARRESARSATARPAERHAARAPGPPAPAKELVVTRVLDAPVERVWQAWTDSTSVTRWWGPDGFTVPAAKMDVRVGGKSLVSLRPPAGQDLYHAWTYEKIVALRRIEFTLDWATRDGTKIEPAALGFPPDFPRSIRHVVTFKPLSGDRTELTITEHGLRADEYFEASRIGLEQSLAKLAASFGGG